MTTPERPNEPASPSWDSGFVRLRLDLAYDGTDFSGWARQPQLRTVQQVLEEALAVVLRLGEPAQLVVAGRTDAGVHATAQVVHVDLAEAPTDLAMVARRLAGVLPDDVAIRSIEPAVPGFDARFSAVARRYRYRVTDGVPDPVRRRDTVAWPRLLDVNAMTAAAKRLLGLHDFAAYCKPRDGATTIRTLHELAAARDGDGVVLIEAYADAFCHHQVRTMVGALLAVGEGRRGLDWPAEILAGGARDHTVIVAPARGLTLVAVDYPPAEELAARAERTRRRRDQ